MCLPPLSKIPQPPRSDSAAQQQQEFLKQQQQHEQQSQQQQQQQQYQPAQQQQQQQRASKRVLVAPTPLVVPALLSMSSLPSAPAPATANATAGGAPLDFAGFTPMLKSPGLGLPFTPMLKSAMLGMPYSPMQKSPGGAELDFSWLSEYHSLPSPAFPPPSAFIRDLQETVLPPEALAAAQAAQAQHAAAMQAVAAAAQGAGVGSLFLPAGLAVMDRTIAAAAGAATASTPAAAAGAAAGAGASMGLMAVGMPSAAAAATAASRAAADEPALRYSHTSSDGSLESSPSPLDYSDDGTSDFASGCNASDSQVPSNKKQRKRKLVSDLSPEEQRRMREVNRIAAQRHRHVTKAKQAEQEERMASMARRNEELRKELEGVAAELGTLKRLVMSVYGPGGPRAGHLVFLAHA